MLPRTWQVSIKGKDLRVLQETGALHYELAELTVNLRMVRGARWEEEGTVAELSVTFTPNEGHRFIPPTA